MDNPTKGLDRFECVGAPIRALANPRLATEDDEAFERHEFRYLYGPAFGAGVQPGRLSSTRPTKLRLYTATLASTRDNVMIQAFHASIAGSASEVRARLAGRFGPYLADTADIRPGIHPGSPLVVALVPLVVVQMISKVQRQNGVLRQREFAVDIQQCIRV